MAESLPFYIRQAWGETHSSGLGGALGHGTVKHIPGLKLNLGPRLMLWALKRATYQKGQAFPFGEGFFCGA